MHNHSPANYDCPLCIFIQGGETEHNKRSDIVYENDNVLAFIAPKWWPNNKGHVLVIPKEHYENIYSTPDEVLGDVYAVVKKIALAIRDSYQCDGISTHQHNEPAGGQSVWHLHAHVFPRYTNDRLYQLHDGVSWVRESERASYAEKLRQRLSLGV